MTDEPYPQPLDLLLTLGEPDGIWPNYPIEYGLSAEHIPDLIRMATDNFRWDEEDDDNPRVYANIHAWRALGQLGAVEAVPHLVKLFNWVDKYDDDWAADDLPDAVQLLGKPAIATLGDFLADPNNGKWACATVCNALELIGKAEADSAPACVSVLMHALTQYKHNDRMLNASIIISLAHLRQPATYALVEEAFQAECVDLMAMGDWEDFQVEVGLLEKRITEPARGLEWTKPPTQEPIKILPAMKKAEKKEKNKHKQEKQSRKQNRKKKK
jgi:hypothetical protein